jgi:hypothetical protein
MRDHKMNRSIEQQSEGKVMLKSRAGFVLGAAALLLALSPGARKAVRSWAVKGVGTALDLTDKVKDMSEGMRTSYKSGSTDQEKVN